MAERTLKLTAPLQDIPIVIATVQWKPENDDVMRQAIYRMMDNGVQFRLSC